MTQEETPLQHRLIEEGFYDFVKACRAHTNVQLNYIDDERFLTRYLEFRGVIFNPDLAIYKMEHTFKNPSLMSSRDEIGEDAARYYQVFIKRYAVVIESAFKNANCELRSQEHMHLSWKEVEAVVQCLADQLKSGRKYINEAAFGFQYSLFVLQFYFADEMNEKIGDLLAEIKFNDVFNIVAELGKVKLQDALECNNVYALTRITLKTTISYSDYSETFALYLANVGLLATLTAHITEISYRDYLKEQAASMFMDNVFELVYNMAYHSDSKTKQKFDATKEALLNFPQVGNDYRGVLIMMSLVYTMDEHELGSLSDEPKVVDTIITYMQEAMVKKERRSNTMSLCELADGLTTLTIKMSNRSKIVNKGGALSALVNMVRHKNPKENASALRCINSLAQYSDVRLALLEFPDLVDAMVDLQMATSVKLRAQIDDTLKTIRSCTSEDSVDSLLSGAVAELNLIQETSTCNNPVRSKLESPLPSTATPTSASNDQTKCGGRSERLRHEDEETLLKNWTYLVENLVPRYVITGLMKRGVFNADDQKDILSHEDVKKQSELFLQKLLNSGPGPAFQHFLEVLETDFDFIVKTLSDTMGK
ncbi:unnamed protein product [Lymnaea stagnalis]|uniref:Uncharacterized protein n=1 Tax=Lymnaea stagnalis TaxID=6523 RepID=A0AAV2I9N1_LYMST